MKWDPYHSLYSFFFFGGVVFVVEFLCKQSLPNSFIIHEDSFPPQSKPNCPWQTHFASSNRQESLGTPDCEIKDRNIKENPPWHHVEMCFDVQGLKWAGSQGANSKVRGRYEIHPWEGDTNPTHLMVAESYFRESSQTEAMLLYFLFKVTNASYEHLWN